MYLWEWFEEISESVSRTREGTCHPIPPSEFLAWATMTGRIVWPSEYAILRAMDRTFCSAMNVEFEEYRARKQAEWDAKNGKG